MNPIKQYRTYYEKCKSLSLNEDDLNVYPIKEMPANDSSEYMDALNRLYDGFKARIEDSMFTTIVKNKYAEKGNNIALVTVDYCADLEGLNELATFFMPQLKSIFGCNVIVDRAYGLRTVSASGKDTGPLLWHFDNYPREIWKIIIYLTDVDKDNAPFVYLYNDDEQSGYQVEPSIPPCYSSSRIPLDIIQKAKEMGFEEKVFVGKYGSAIIFNTNNAHRATHAIGGLRDVMTLQVRPCDFEPDKYVSTAWTGGVVHHSYNPDPFDLNPALADTNVRKVKKMGTNKNKIGA